MAQIATAASSAVSRELCSSGHASDRGDLPGMPSKLLARHELRKPGAADALAILFEVRDPMAHDELLNRPCGGRFGNVVESIGNTPLVELPRLAPKPEVRIYAKLEGRNPTGSVKDRVARSMIEAAEAEGAIAARPDDPRADLRQHRHLAGDDLPPQGLPAEGRDARQRHRGAHPAAAHVRGGDRLLGGRQGLQRGGRGGAGDVPGPQLLHALPVRQRGQPARPLQRHRGRDPRRARRGRRLRRRPRHRRHADGQRAAAQGGRTRRR